MFGGKFPMARELQDATKIQDHKQLLQHLQKSLYKKRLWEKLEFFPGKTAATVTQSYFSFYDRTVSS